MGNQSSRCCENTLQQSNCFLCNIITAHSVIILLSIAQGTQLVKIQARSLCSVTTDTTPFCTFPILTLAMACLCRSLAFSRCSWRTAAKCCTERLVYDNTHTKPCSLLMCTVHIFWWGMLGLLMCAQFTCYGEECSGCKNQFQNTSYWLVRQYLYCLFILLHHSLSHVVGALGLKGKRIRYN